MMNSLCPNSVTPWSPCWHLLYHQRQFLRRACPTVPVLSFTFVCQVSLSDAVNRPRTLPLFVPVECNLWCSLRRNPFLVMRWILWTWLMDENPRPHAKTLATFFRHSGFPWQDCLSLLWRECQVQCFVVGPLHNQNTGCNSTRKEACHPKTWDHHKLTKQSEGYSLVFSTPKKGEPEIIPFQCFGSWLGPNTGGIGVVLVTSQPAPRTLPLSFLTQNHPNYLEDHPIYTPWN